MTPEEFDHAIRAAGSVLGESEVLVIGSQAIHGSLLKSIPEEALRSVEVDVAGSDDPDDSKADLIDGRSVRRRCSMPGWLLRTGRLAGHRNLAEWLGGASGAIRVAGYQWGCGLVS